MRARAEPPVRPGEELDVAAVDRWLRTIDPGLEGVPEVTQYAGGASNWTYRLRYRNRDLVLRRPPAGTKARTAHDVAARVDDQCLRRQQRFHVLEEERPLRATRDHARRGRAEDEACAVDLRRQRRDACVVRRPPRAGGFCFRL